MNEQVRENVSDTHTAWIGKIVGAALQGGSLVYVCRELSCSKYSLHGWQGARAASQTVTSLGLRPSLRGVGEN